MKRIAVWLCWLLLAGGIVWKFPLFTIVRSAERELGAEAEAFDAAAFAKSFWNERLLPSLRDGPNISDAATVIEALRENSQKAGREFGRKVGISRARLFMLRGSGVVASADKKGVCVTLKANGSTPDIVLHTGPVFGNIVRDASGLLDPSEFSNSQHWNDISTELNRMVEERVIPKIKELSLPEQRIQFVGCAEVPDDGLDIGPLKVIALDIRLQ